MKDLDKGSSLSPNSLYFIGLCREYCSALNDASDKDELVVRVLGLLPRLYISATDIKVGALDGDAFFDETLTEDEYSDLQQRLGAVFGEDDVYLEVFEENMKYSDTPVAASISEDLCDIFQVLYNFLAVVRDATEDDINSALASVSEDFGLYWSKPLCNVMRALNNLRYQ